MDSVILTSFDFTKSINFNKISVFIKKNWNSNLKNNEMWELNLEKIEINGKRILYNISFLN